LASATCTDCPAGRFSTELAAASFEACVACPAGRFSEQPAQSLAASCVLCAAGTASAAEAGAFLPLVVVLGFYGATPLYIFCYLRLYAGKNALVSAATAFGVMGCLYLVFEGLMGYAIFAGLLGGDTL
jgi:hypothetical protein